MRKHIGILTSTRAEFGLLKPLILGLMKEDFCETEVLVTGTHLSPEFGNTYTEIESANIPIAAKISCITDGDAEKNISYNMAEAMRGFADYFSTHSLDLIIVLGDRYEAMAVCIAAMISRIPIAHIHGGETTEGAIDEAIRHSITKMSHLHFVSTEIYRNRVIQLGEDPCRVYNVGALAIENIQNNQYLSRRALEDSIHFKLDRPFGIVTYHPVTLDSSNGVNEFSELTAALNEFPDMKFIITKSNADSGGRRINRLIDDYSHEHDNVLSIASLGVQRYLSAIKESIVVIGNSSSGIIEAPCLHTPTVNIGDRQKGRIMPENIICCSPERNDIVNAIKKSISPEFQKAASSITNPYGNGDTSFRIIEIIKKNLSDDSIIDLKKKFYDIHID